MNKTIIININGTVFHIEEDAYEVLKNYMTDVKRHFADAEDSFEITTDIENRIAEMFSEMLNEAKQVIVTTDVNAVITQMGTVDEFETPEAGHKTNYADQQTFTDNRKLFRDPDDHLLGGVCAGIASYFDVSTVWVRLAFGLASMLWATGVLLYIVLWIILPKAVTRADKMAMKGEKLDLQGFKKNFEEEMKNVSETLNHATKHARPFIYQFRDFIGDFFHHLGMFTRGIGRMILKVTGAFVVAICFIIALALTVSFIICFTVGQHEAWQMFHISLPYYHDSYLILVSGFIIVLLPLIAILQLTLRVVFNRNLAHNRSTGYSMFIIWILAVSCAAYFGVKIGRDFSAYASFSRNIVIKPTANNTYLLTLNNVRDISKEDSLRLNIKNRFKGDITINEDEFDEFNNYQQRMSLNIERSDVAQPVLTESFSAHGRDYDDALLKAQNTAYHFLQQDSVLKFNRRLQNFSQDPFERQQIELTLKVPMNAQVIIDKNIRGFLRNVDVRDCNDTNKQDDPQYTHFYMSDNGIQCKVDTMPKPIASQPAKH